jgi:hypothetical protein
MKQDDFIDSLLKLAKRQKMAKAFISQTIINKLRKSKFIKFTAVKICEKRELMLSFLPSNWCFSPLVWQLFGEIESSKSC